MDLGNYEKFPDSDAFTTVYHPNIKINKLMMLVCRLMVLKMLLAQICMLISVLTRQP